MTKNNRIYDLLIDRLLKAHYAFGERILVKELAAETGISRQPIMTALNKLHSDGFVRIVPQVGCEVIDPTPVQIADFFLMFERMEGLLAELAAARRTDKQLRELKLIQLQLKADRRPKITPQEYCEINREFHQMIHVMAHSPLLDDKQRNNFNMADFFINQAVGFEGFMVDAMREHEDILGLLEKRDAKRARKESEAHIAAVREAVLSGLPSTRAH
jgi:DNA-binding GntR family transcriptional regulator